MILESNFSVENLHRLRLFAFWDNRVILMIVNYNSMEKINEKERWNSRQNNPCYNWPGDHRLGHNEQFLVGADRFAAPDHGTGRLLRSVCDSGNQDL